MGEEGEEVRRWAVFVQPLSGAPGWRSCDCPGLYGPGSVVLACREANARHREWWGTPGFLCLFVPVLLEEIPS